MTNKQLEAKLAKLDREVKRMGKSLTELLVSTLWQYRCKTCHLYHFPEPLKGCVRKDEAAREEKGWQSST